ncbi:MAG: hypothetical protein PWP23_2549 [Candidatus Sumerlaeota bacterium]|nr:hypothetical protein [Candidatus Sumerlaeota bacterium]
MAPDDVPVEHARKQRYPALAGEAELLERARKGEREAYGTVVEHYRDRLYAAAAALLRDHEEARDASQEAFVRAYQNLHRFELRRPFYPWLYRILRNLCLDHLRKHGPARSVSLESLVEERHVQFSDADGKGGAGSATGIREDLHRREMARHLRSCIDDLKPEFREIILMKHFQDMAYKDIAEALDIPIGTVMSRLFHARKALGTLMEKHRA